MTTTPSTTPSVTPTVSITPSVTPSQSLPGSVADKLESCETSTQSQKVFVFYDGTSLDTTELQQHLKVLGVGMIQKFKMVNYYRVTYMRVLLVIIMIMVKTAMVGILPIFRFTNG